MMQSSVQPRKRQNQASTQHRCAARTLLQEVAHTGFTLFVTLFYLGDSGGVTTSPRATQLVSSRAGMKPTYV